jgi:Lipopolysaccharide-assembly
MKSTATATAGFLLAGWMAVGLCGCAGYHVGPTQPLNYHTVAVPMFKNRTLKPQLEAQVTNAIIKRFQSDGTLQVESAANADIILTGQITKYYRRALRVLAADATTPREYRIFIEVRVEARDRVTGELIFAPVMVDGSTDTFIGSDQQSSEEQALPLVADDLAKHVVTILAERW